MMQSADLRSEIRWLSSGFLLMLLSGFGQTFFIGLFKGHFITELGLSEGQFGALYTAGTLASAALLMWLGKLADHFTIRTLGAMVLAGLALVCLGTAWVFSAWTLMLVIFGLRFFGQGMLPHVAMTAMGRWFNRKRGRAVSIAALGLPAASAILPYLAVTAVALIGWRQTWAASAVLIILLPLPLLIILLRRERSPRSQAATGVETPGRRQWTRAEVLASPLFYALIPGVLALPFISTGLFINQTVIVETKGWELAWFAAAFPLFAAFEVAAALICGWLVDRAGARRLLPFYLLPLALGIFILAYTDAAWAIAVFMALAGLSHGSGSTIQGALWPELYGTAHLGAIRGTVVSVVVLSTALSPALIGILMDLGVAFETQLVAMAFCCLVAAMLMGLLRPRLNRLAMA